MRKFAIATTALAAIFLCGLPIAANAATAPAAPRTADQVWELVETGDSLYQCNVDGEYFESVGQTTDYTCDAGDNGSEDGLYALWILVDE